MDTELWTGVKVSQHGYWIMDGVQSISAWILDYGQGLKYPSMDTGLWTGFKVSRMDTGLWTGFKVSQHGYRIMDRV